MDELLLDFATLSMPLAFKPLNLLLLDEQVSALHLEKSDPRSLHLLDVSKVKEGDIIDLAVKNGPKGKGCVKFHANGSLALEIEWFPRHPSDLYPISLVIGLSRPQTCRKILEQATTLGVRRFAFFNSDKGESSYAQSSLWSTDEWSRKIDGGVEQAFASYVPECHCFDDLEAALKKDLGPESDRCKRVALDNYEAEVSLHQDHFADSSTYSLCIGSERGWSERERQLLRRKDYEFFNLGRRVLRVETAVVVSLGMLASAFWKKD